MRVIERNKLREMLSQDDISLIEVLAPGQYRKFHLPRAMNVPLADDFDSRVQEAVPNKRRPVVVYCSDADCDASPTAAKRMEELGYVHVFDYAAGKEDWKEAGLPIVGEGAEARGA